MIVALCSLVLSTVLGFREQHHNLTTLMYSPIDSHAVDINKGE
jgi:hypothetical protein